MTKARQAYSIIKVRAKKEYEIGMKEYNIEINLVTCPINLCARTINEIEKMLNFDIKHNMIDKKIATIIKNTLAMYRQEIDAEKEMLKAI